MRAAERRAILERYADSAPGRALYRRLRLARAGYAAIERLVPRAGLVVDLGAGEGLLAHALSRDAPDRRILAVDHDPRRMSRLRASAAGLAIEARVGDFTRVDLPPCDALLLVDVLHYLDRAGQERLLARAVVALRPGGLLLLRDPDAGAGWKFGWNRLHERLATRFGFTRAHVGAYRTSGAWAALLSDLGLSDVVVHPRGRMTPYADRIVTAIRTVPGTFFPPPKAARKACLAPYRGCPVCRGRRRRRALAHPQGSLSRCLRCGLVSVDALPTADAALRLYDAAYFRGEAGYRDYAAEEANFRREFRRRLRRVLSVARGARLLDVGAAAGFFLLEARARGFSATGLEPVDAVARSARDRGLDVRTGTVESASFPPASFDVVTMLDALEHVVDPVEALRRLRGWLRPGGLLVLSVPDFGGAWARLSGARWPFVTPHEHLHYFTRRTIRAALRVAGFDVLSTGLAGTPVSWGSLARKAAGRRGPALERALGPLAARGTALPFGTLLVLARPSPS